MVFLIPILLLSCTNETQTEIDSTEPSPFLKSVRLERYSVAEGDPDSITLSTYILRTYNEEGQEAKSVYYSADNSVMMQFENTYQNGNKTQIDWVNAQGELVKYVKTTFNEKNELIRSESFSPEGEFKSGFIHNWKEDGRVEEKGPIEEDKPFKPNAIYFYNSKEDMIRLEEFDVNDSLYAIFQWKYLKYDDNGNWTEREMAFNDTLTRVEKREIEYDSSGI